MGSVTSIVVDLILKHPYDENHESMGSWVARVDRLLASISPESCGPSGDAQALVRELSGLKLVYQEGLISAQAYLNGIVALKTRAVEMQAACH